MEQKIPEERLLDMIRKPAAGQVVRSARVLSRVPLLRIFQAVSVVCVVLLVIEFLLPRFPFAEMIEETAGREEWESGLSRDRGQPVEAYLAEVRAAHLFGSDVSGSAAEGGGLPDDISQVTLAGIVFDEAPQAILKDSRNGNLLYLRVGEAMGGMKVVGITEGKIEVEYKGERYEMHL